MIGIGSKRSHILIVIAFSFLIYLLGNEAVALWDRDEPRYAQASREMLQSGDWIVPTFAGQPRINKPPLIYWCQATVMRVLGETAFAARLPSVIAVTLTLLLLAGVIRYIAGPLRAFWTVLILASSALGIMSAKMCITDGLLLLWITIAQLCVYSIWQGNASWRIVLILGISIGLAGLTKGPIVLGILATTLLMLGALRWLDYLQQRRIKSRNNDRFRRGACPPLLQRADGADKETQSDTESPDNKNPRDGSAGQAPRRNEAGEAPFSQDVSKPVTLSYFNPRDNRASFAQVFLKTFVAITLIVACVAPWIYAMEKRMPGYTLRILGKEIVNRSREAQEGHTGPPGYYLLTIWGTFFPWSLLLPLAIVYAWKHRATPLIRFSLAAVVGPWIMLEIVKTKLPHYLLPAFPFLAILTADALIRCIRKRSGDLHDRRWIAVMGGWASLVTLLALTPWLSLIKYRPQPMWALVVTSLVGIAFGWLVFHSFLRRRIARAGVMMGIGMLLIVGTLYTVYLPRAWYLDLSRRIATKQLELGYRLGGWIGTGPPYNEPSLAFYQRRRHGVILGNPFESRPVLELMTRAYFEQYGRSNMANPPVMLNFKGLSYADEARDVEVMLVLIVAFSDRTLLPSDD